MSYIFSSILLAIVFEAMLRLRLNSTEYRARIVETVFALGIGLSAIVSLLLNRKSGIFSPNETGAFGRQTLLIALGFFIYHLHRVIFIKGFTRSLIVHHVGMILCLLFGLITETAHFYILLASIPITSAAMRNFRWFWKSNNKPRWENRAFAVAISYVLFESVPPLFAVGHFFTVGMNSMNLTRAHWVFLIVPGLILSLLTFYWSYVFLKKTLFVARDSSSLA